MPASFGCFCPAFFVEIVEDCWRRSCLVPLLGKHIIDSNTNKRVSGVFHFIVKTKTR